MLAETGHTAAGESDGSAPAPLTLLRDRESYERQVNRMVDELAPRMFAVVQDYGDQEDSRIAAWGLAFEDYAEIVSVDGDLRVSTDSMERAVNSFSQPPDVTARVVWGAPEPSDRADT